VNVSTVASGVHFVKDFSDPMKVETFYDQVSGLLASKEGKWLPSGILRL
jgi:hypothetical protein